jgi:uracil-DNA glycosylase
MAAVDSRQEARFRTVFRKVHTGHPACLQDEWLTEPCRLANGAALDRPIVWSRRNGPWRRVPVLWVGAAPGNAGGMGSGELGAHGTRIPFGGDVAGANMDVLLASVGLDRNHTFIVAALNQLPTAGGGEPRTAELAEPVGDYPNSIRLLRDTILAAGPALVVALGNVALRSVMAAGRRTGDGASLRLPGLARLRKAGMMRGVAAAWPEDEGPTPAFLAEWRTAWGDAPLPRLLWLLHPSAQNMSPYAGVGTAFHGRMVDTRDVLRAAVRDVLGTPLPAERPRPPSDGIYALPEWRERIGPRHMELDALWRGKGI